MGERIKVYAAWAVVVSFVAALFYLFFRYAFGVIAPFLFGYLIALAARRPAAALHKKCRLSEGVCRLGIALLFSVTVALLLFFSVKTLAKEIFVLVESMGEDLPLGASSLLARAPLLSSLLENHRVVEKVTSSFVSVLPTLASGWLRALPRLLFSIAVGGIASVYFCLGLERVHAAVARLLPSAFLPYVRAGKRHLLSALTSVLRSSGILMAIAFALMLAGFWLLEIPYSFLLAAVFSLLDLLPVIGVGVFLFPMGLLYLLAGETFVGVGILILVAVIAVVRQVLEPRILGAEQGVPPLLVLFSLYAGAALFGGVGVILFPVILILLYSLFCSGEKRKGASATEAQKGE
ncbi:MAG: AI-2E family transporter [Clostridia bacterium]|nr:AI-2E family transporter [Clostridia bacterium]